MELLKTPEASIENVPPPIASMEPVDRLTTEMIFTETLASEVPL